MCIGGPTFGGKVTSIAEQMPPVSSAEAFTVMSIPMVQRCRPASGSRSTARSGLFVIVGPSCTIEAPDPRRAHIAGFGVACHESRTRTPEVPYSRIIGDQGTHGPGGQAEAMSENSYQGPWTIQHFSPSK